VGAPGKKDVKGEEEESKREVTHIATRARLEERLQQVELVG
jgi:hypothetical protein